tara:strand:- start:284 stop:649 length:366 start_codon:yes stop_codon:yes gene_type:complete
MGIKIDYPRLTATERAAEKKKKIFSDFESGRKKLKEKFADRGTSGAAEQEKQEVRQLDKTLGKLRKVMDAEKKDLDLVTRYGKDAYKSRSFASGKKAGGKVKVMKMRGGGLATQGTKFSIR